MADAPRLMFYLGRTEGTTILTMARSAWQDLIRHQDKPIAFDVRSTPMRGVSDVASVIGAVAHEFTGKSARVSIYRNDPKDAPTPVNVDHYRVITDLTGSPELQGWITAASTSYNENMRTFLRDNVFLLKEKPGSDHWLTTVPNSIYAVLKSS